MADVVSKEKRSKMMSNIQAKNTKPELKIRSALHRIGYRYKLHDKELPGKPDLVFPKYRAIIFINGCFWHLHSCHLFKWPSTRRKFWRAKITGNRERDLDNINLLKDRGWRVMVLWECALKGKHKRSFDYVIDSITVWLESGVTEIEISGESKE
jgi:DNA mismatch endonuclease (patch repair protein)